MSNFHRNNIKKPLCFLIFFLIAVAILNTLSEISAKDPRWIIVSEEDGVKVSRRALPESPIAEFRTEGRVEATCTKVISMLSDLTYYPNWIENCIKAELLEKNFSAYTYDMPLNEYYQILYAETDFPFPFHNRDYILKGSISYVPPKDARSEYYVLESHTVEHQKKPRQQGKVRMTIMNIMLKLTPMGKDRQKTHIDMIIHGDPGGSFPDWLFNLLAKDIFRSTFKRMRKLVLKKTYDRSYERLIRYHINMNSKAHE